MLRSLEVFGFKSFADRTIFEFSAGITGVVGPNGSGKSNVVDSIKWILGDQSARSLRGREMTDVIFNGSSSRGGAQFAEASLVFDNRTRFLPLDLDEVSVGRRLWKSGDSEYLINRSPARLKDVRELFSGTGAGSSAYCIIEQGRVDQILQSNAANRRLIFEEAAGIARFKTRKIEATRRLERVEQNLLRLSDIVDEVESQVGTIRSQAQRAARFRDVSVELEQLWTGMVSDDYRRQTMVQADLAARRQTASEVLSQMRERREQAEQASAESDAALSTVDEQIRNLESGRADLRSQVASLETTIRHQSTRESELASELQRLHRQLAVMDARVAEAEQEKRHLTRVFEIEQQKLEEHRVRQNTCNSHLNDLRDGLQQSQQGIEESRAKLIEQFHDNSSLASRIGGLRSEEEAAGRRMGELNSNHQQQSGEYETQRNRLIQLKQERGQATERLLEVRNTVDRVLKHRNSISVSQSDLRDSLADLREQRSAATARRTVLEDLEDRQEGFGIGVREILSRSADSTRSPWNLIRGSVADMLDVEMQHAALMEVALSGRAQLLVIDRMQPLIDYLGTGRCRITGRVGFVSLETAEVTLPTGNVPVAESDDQPEHAEDRPGTRRPPVFDNAWLDDVGNGKLADEFTPELNITWVDSQRDVPVRQSVFSPSTTPSLTGQPGVLGRADSMARPTRYSPFLSALLLADTWVVDSLSSAFRIVRESRGMVRAITLQGELVEKDGTLHAGMVHSETAVVSRKSELRRLKKELHRIEHLIAERELQLQRIAGEIESNDANLVELQQTVADATERCRGAEQNESEILQALTFSEQRIEQLQNKLLQARQELESVTVRRQAVIEDHRAGEKRLQELQRQVAEHEVTFTRNQQEVDQLERGHTESSLEFTRLEERALSLDEATDRLREDLQQRCLQQQEASRRLTAGQSRVHDLTLAKLNVRAELAELFVTSDQLQTQVVEQSLIREVLRSRRQEAIQLESEVRKRCGEYEQQHHDLELQISGIDHQLATSAERIQDEFQMEIEDAVRQGRSALVIWLSEQRKDSDNRRTESDRPVHGPANLELTVTSPEVVTVLEDEAHYSELREAIERRVDRLRRRLRQIGSVSTESLDVLNDLETRFDRLNSQLRDLEAARDALRDMVRRINTECRRMFLESFECIRTHFRELFRRLFGGGEADLVLEDPEDVLDCSIDVVARPPGKELRSISLLSGGEKTLTAVALLLSIFRSRPNPFCLLDEVDAALDDANISRFVGVLRDFRDDTQFIMITHRKPTMAVTDVLYGVTMEESGISKRLSVRFEEIDEHGNFIARNDGQAKAA